MTNATFRGKIVPSRKPRGNKSKGREMKITLTEMERTILDDIPKDCFYDDGLDSVIWADCFLDTTSIPPKQARGVLSSLVQKGILKPIFKNRDENTISFTEYGKQVMRSLGY